MSACQVIPLPTGRGRDDAPGLDRAVSAMRHAGDELWPAWRSLEDWEDTVVDAVGEPLGRLVLLLWTVHRFRGTDAVVLADELADDSGGDALLVDIAEVAFALGAAWAGQRGSGVTS